MQGTVLQSSNQAAPFELQDQFGKTVSLEDYRGKVVVLTFLYTSCHDICPLITSHLKQTHKSLGARVNEVAFVAISVDPAKDSVEEAYSYSERWGMLDKWVFLSGHKEQLAPIWKAYYIDPLEVNQVHVEIAIQSQTNLPQSGSIETLRQDSDPTNNITHAGPVYLIDRQGLMKVLFSLPINPDNLVHDIKLLLD